TAGCAIPAPQDALEIFVNGSLQDTVSPAPAGNFQRLIRLVNGPNTVRVCVRDQAGNESCADDRHITVSLPIPLLRIESPLPGALLTRADDLDPTTDVLDFAPLVTAQNLPVGTRVTLEVDYGAQTCSGTLVLEGTTLVTQILCAVSDGVHVLQAIATDGSGNT